MKSIGKFLLILILTGPSAGCIEWYIAGLATGVGGYFFYDQGSVGYEYDMPIDKVWPAALGAVAVLKYKMISSKQEGKSGIIKAETTVGTKQRVFISVKQQDKGRTIVATWVGWYGNKNEGNKIHDQIHSMLTNPNSRFQ